MAPSAIDGASSSEVEALDFKTFHNYINGKATDSTNHRHGINPATLEALPEVPIATKEDLDTCIETANVAFKKWRYVSWEDRKSALLKFADLMDANLKGFSNLLTLEQGKPVCCHVICLDYERANPDQMH
jgi:acyl-CoA reductase-like NAD-dependent aldehyde dehydrogenase